MRDWIDYYDSQHTIYVSERHRDVHFRRIAEDIRAYIPAPDAVVLDYSCGEALAADSVAAACGRLILAEPAPGVRARLTAHFGGNPKIAVRSLDEAAALPPGSVDLVVMHSVAQYMTEAELDAALGDIRRLLRPSGRFVLGDILQPGVSSFADATALIRFGWREGFFLPAVTGLGRMVFSDYWRLRSAIGLTRYSEPTLTAKLAAAGFAARRAPANIGHIAARMTFVCKPA